MSDRIDGVAILDETVLPARLHFVCVRTNGDRAPWIDGIPVRPEGTPEIPDRTTWEFRPDGELLQVHPSVRMSYVESYTDDVPPKPIWKEFFHNDGQWAVRFERWAGGDSGEIYARMKQLNAALLDPVPVSAPSAQPSPVGEVVPKSTPSVASSPSRLRWRSNRGFQTKPKR
jgi:hypothetical protein